MYQVRLAPTHQGPCAPEWGVCPLSGTLGASEGSGVQQSHALGSHWFFWNLSLASPEQKTEKSQTPKENVYFILVNIYWALSPCQALEQIQGQTGQEKEREIKQMPGAAPTEGPGRLGSSGVGKSQERHQVLWAAEEGSSR